MSNVRRAMRLLELLAAEADGARLVDLAQALGVNRAVPHRLLAELMDMGYVHQDPATERYVASFRLGGLGLKQLESAGLERWSQTVLQELASTTEELVRLAVADDSGLRWVRKEQGSNSALSFDPASGSEVVLHATASGKAWLSTLTSEEVKRVLGRTQLEPRTARTATDLDDLLQELETVRDQGFAIVREEMDIGINAIAAPIVASDRSGRGVGTISVAGPSPRLTDDVLLGFAPLVVDAADRLGREWAVYRHLSQPATAVAGH